MNWDAWVKNGGANPPEVGLDFSTPGALQFETLADQYIQLGGDSTPANYKDYVDATDP